MKSIQNVKESFVEVFIIAWACLTSFWFWLPVLFTAYMYFQLWAIFFVHPLTVSIIPIVISIFAMIFERKRLEAHYGLDEVKLLKASDPIGSGPVWKKVRRDVEKGIREYQKFLEKKDKEKTKKDT